MRMSELHTLSTPAVKQVLESNLSAQKNLKRFSQSWKMSDNIVTICRGILNSRKG